MLTLKANKQFWITDQSYFWHSDILWLLYMGQMRHTDIGTIHWLIKRRLLGCNVCDTFSDMSPSAVSADGEICMNERLLAWMLASKSRKHFWLSGTDEQTALPSHKSKAAKKIKLLLHRGNNTKTRAFSIINESWQEFHNEPLDLWVTTKQDIQIQIATLWVWASNIHKLCFSFVCLVPFHTSKNIHKINKPT